MEQPLRQEPSGNVDVFVQSNLFFKDLDPATLHDLEVELETVVLPKGQALFQRGDPGDSMFVVLSGMLVVTVSGPSGVEVRMDVLDSGASVGEMALLTGQPRSATVRGLVDTSLVRLSKAGFERLAENHPRVTDLFSQAALPRFQRAQLAEVLSGLFGPFDAAALHDLQSRTVWKHLDAGETLFRQGEPGDSMCVVVSGRLKIVVESGEIETLLSEVSRGETVGEFALLSGEPRTASVIAVRDTDLVVIDRSVFQSLVEKQPQALLEITRSIIRRSFSNTRRPAFDSSTTAAVAVLPSGPGLPLAQVAQQLAASLETFGPTLVLTSDSFDRMYGKPGASRTAHDHPANLTILNWLSEQESRYRYIVYQADPALTAWSQRCIRQADRILVLADTTGQPEKSAIQTALGNGKTDERAELVLIQPDTAARPTGTLPWLDLYPFHSYHHVRLSAPSDFRRLARRLTGRATGLVLSGGGARGFAHLGAIHALEEAGIEIDLIGGTSMGSLIGGALAMDMDYAHILEMAKIFASPKKLLDYTLPYAAMMASKKITTVLQHAFEDTKIEDLWRTYFCISSNLTRAEPVVHRSGPLWEAVRASIAIPGIFAPMQIGSDVLVDGGVMNNFPADVMFELCEGGPVIGVNASPKKDRFDQYSFGPSVSGWEILWNKINPLAKRQKQKVPSILNSLIRSTEINSIYRRGAQEQLADLLIVPPVTEYGSLDFGAYEEILRIGYETAQKQLQGWKRT